MFTKAFAFVTKPQTVDCRGWVLRRIRIVSLLTLGVFLLQFISILLALSDKRTPTPTSSRSVAAITLAFMRRIRHPPLPLVAFGCWSDRGSHYLHTYLLTYYTAQLTFIVLGNQTLFFFDNFSCLKLTSAKKIKLWIANCEVWEIILGSSFFYYCNTYFAQVLSVCCLNIIK